MIISYKHKFIFVHCRKVAGTSITVTLARHLGYNDILIGPWPSIYQHNINPNLRFYMDLMKPYTMKIFASLIKNKPHTFKTRKRFLIQLNKIHNKIYKDYFSGDPTHPPAKEIRAFDPKAWENFFKFCFIRNPYERAVSDYLFLSRILRIDISFRGFLGKLENQMESGIVFKSDYDNWPMYTIKNEIAVDFVGRYENLEKDMAIVLNLIGLKGKQGIPTTNNQKTNYQYKDFYGLREKMMVEKIFSKEIEYFGYEY